MSDIWYKPGRFGNKPAKGPCVECPLRRDSKPGALGGYTVRMYLEALHGPADIACHMSKGFPNNPAEQRSCTGVAQYRVHTSCNPAGQNAKDAMYAVDENREQVFASPSEFIYHHGACDADKKA